MEVLKTFLTNKNIKFADHITGGIAIDWVSENDKGQIYIDYIGECGSSFCFRQVQEPFDGYELRLYYTLCKKGPFNFDLRDETMPVLESNIGAQTVEQVYKFIQQVLNHG